MTTLSIIVPSHNEGKEINDTLARLSQCCGGISYEIIIVVDTLDDETRRHVSETGDVRFALNSSGGFAKAIETGLKEARGEYAVVVMADGSDDLSNIPLMLDCAKGGFDVVGATRYGKGGKQVNAPKLKAFYSKTVNLLAYLRGLPLTDATNAFKLYRLSEVRKLLPLESKHFEVTLELCVKAHRQGLRMAEVPTTWTERTAGQSKFNARKMFIGYVKWLLR